MKSTGVVRRIDELGRIVIPKEIRKKLRIHDGDNLEIFIDDKENIILSKYSSMGVVNELAQNIVQVIHKNINCDVFITSNDKIIAASKNKKNNYELKEICPELIKYLQKREIYQNTEKIDLKIIDKEVLNGYFFINPIIVNSDSIGLIIIYSEEKIDELTVKLMQIINSIFTKYLED